MVSFIPSYDVGSLFLPLADPTLAEPSIPTAHGSSHGLTPAAPFSRNPLHNVQCPQHYTSPDIYTYHHSAPSTIFTPGGSLGNNSYLFRGAGLSTVTQDEPEVDCLSVNEVPVMRLYSRNSVLLNLARIYICPERFHVSDAFSVTNVLIRELFNFAGL